MFFLDSGHVLHVTTPQPLENIPALQEARL
jgi:hypothetical protein